MRIQGRSQDFSKGVGVGGGHTGSYTGYSPDCHLNILVCLLTKRLTKGGGGGHGHPRTPPLATPLGLGVVFTGWVYCMRFSIQPVKRVLGKKEDRSVSGPKYVPLGHKHEIHLYSLMQYLIKLAFKNLLQRLWSHFALKSQRHQLIVQLNSVLSGSPINYEDYTSKPSIFVSKH